MSRIDDLLSLAETFEEQTTTRDTLYEPLLADIGKFTKPEVMSDEDRQAKAFLKGAVDPLAAVNPATYLATLGQKIVELSERQAELMKRSRKFKIPFVIAAKEFVDNRKKIGKLTKYVKRALEMIAAAHS